MSIVTKGSVWRDKADKRKIATVLDNNPENGCYPVRLSVSYRTHKLHTGFSDMSESFACTEDYVTNLYEFISGGEE